MANHLTVREIQNLKPDPTKRREVSDGRSGLFFVIQPSGATSWAFRYRFGGQPRKLTIGAYPLFGLNDRNYRFCLAILCDRANQKQAAIKAGWAEKNAAQAGSRAIRGEHVMQFMEAARRAGWPDSDQNALLPAIGSADEMKKILWAHARGQDKSASLRALEVIQRVTAFETELQRSFGGDVFDPGCVKTCCFMRFSQC